MGTATRVLMLLDDAALALRLSLDLTATGHVVDMARTPDRALELVRRHAYDVVIVDVRFCERGGADAPAASEAPVLHVIAPEGRAPRRILLARRRRRMLVALETVLEQGAANADRDAAPPRPSQG